MCLGKIRESLPTLLTVVEPSGPERQTDNHHPRLHQCPKPKTLLSVPQGGPTATLEFLVSITTLTWEFPFAISKQIQNAKELQI